MMLARVVEEEVVASRRLARGGTEEADWTR